MKEQNAIEQLVSAVEKANKNSEEKNWDGVSSWEKTSGTGEGAQISTLKYNLENFIPKMKAIMGQTDLIKGNESVNKLVEKAKEFMEEFEEFKQSK